MTPFKDSLRATVRGIFSRASSLDDETVIGKPPHMLGEGTLSDLRRADAVIVGIIGTVKAKPNMGVCLARPHQQDDKPAELKCSCSAVL